MISQILASKGFDVVVRVDLDFESLLQEIKDLKRRASSEVDVFVKPVALFYFSGHGFTQAGRQFVAGIDAGNPIEDPALRSIALDWVIENISAESILFGLLDACRTDFGSRLVAEFKIEQFSGSASG